MSLPMVPKWVTSNDLEWRNSPKRGVISSNSVAYVEVVEDTLINVIIEVDKNGYRRRSCTSKTTKIHHYVRFVMYCIITTVPLAFY